MSSAATSSSEQPRQQGQLMQRKIAIHRQMRRLKEQEAADAAARNFRHADGPISDPPTEEEVNRRRSLEANERQAAAKREQEWIQLQEELEEINRMDRAYSSTMTPGRERDSARTRHPKQSPRLEVNDSDAVFPDGPVSPTGAAIQQAIDTENVGESDADDELKGSDESDEDDGWDEDNKLDVSDDPSANLPRTRYISMQALNEQGLMGVGIYSALYRNEATDALYFLNHLSEKIWLIDEYGDCVLAQDQDPDQITQPPFDGPVS